MKIVLKYIKDWSIIIYRAGYFLEKKIKVLGNLVDNYSIDKIKDLKEILNSPCEIAFRCFQHSLCVISQRTHN